jgi:hypothetical protein
MKRTVGYHTETEIWGHDKCFLAFIMGGSAGQEDN